jgi:uncharacterized coiled-coil DUF342 family protein
MKKLMVMVLTVVFMFTMAVGVFAEEPNKRETNPETKAKIEQIRLLADELKAVHDEIKGLHEQIVAKHEIIKPLIKAAREAKDFEKLEAGKSLKEQLNTINAELETIREDRDEIKLMVKTAREAKDFDTVIAGMTELLGYKGQVLSLINQKLVILDEIIVTLQ